MVLREATAEPAAAAAARSGGCCRTVSLSVCGPEPPTDGWRWRVATARGFERRARAAGPGAARQSESPGRCMATV